MSIYFSDLQWIAQKSDIVELKENKHDLLTPNLTVLERQTNEHLIQFMQTKNTFMLGTYYEALWEYYLSHHPQCELIAKNIQINDHLNKRNGTIGEMDFIYWHIPLKTYVHLEVAIKFYLQCDEPISDHIYSQWLGPRCNDRLDLKFEKLMQHQTKLIDLASTTHTIAPLIEDHPIISRAVLQGRLFEKFKHDFQAGVNYWFSADAFEAWFNASHLNCPIVFLEKPHWLSVSHGCDLTHQKGLTLSQALTRVKNQPFALPFVIKHPQTETNCMIFIAPNEWPTR